MRTSRRIFLSFLGSAVIGAATGPVAYGTSGCRKPAGVLVDIHTHLFGVGDGGTGCVLSCKQRAHWNFRFLLKLMGLAENGHLDEDYVQWMVAAVAGVLRRPGGPAGVELPVRSRRATDILSDNSGPRRDDQRHARCDQQQHGRALAGGQLQRSAVRGDFGHRL